MHLKCIISTNRPSDLDKGSVLPVFCVSTQTTKGMAVLGRTTSLDKDYLNGLDRLLPMLIRRTLTIIIKSGQIVWSYADVTHHSYRVRTLGDAQTFWDCVIYVMPQLRPF